MKSIITKNIDGIEIVTGFGKVQIDPVKTQKKQRNLLANSPEFQAMQEAVEVIHNIKPAIRKNNKSKMRWYNEMQAGREVLKSTHEAVDEFKKANFDSCIIYMESRKSETRDGDRLDGKKINVDSITEKFKALKHGELLRTDGTAVKDQRKIEFWNKVDGRWNWFTATRLDQNIPAGSIMFLDLPDTDRAEILTQRAADKIAALTPGDKEQAKRFELAAAAGKASADRSIAEIQGTAPEQALADAQAAYQTAAAVIGERYQ